MHLVAPNFVQVFLLVYFVLIINHIIYFKCKGKFSKIFFYERLSNEPKRIFKKNSASFF